MSKLVAHKLRLEISYEAAAGWEAANKIAMEIGEDVLTRWDAVFDVEGHVDPEITEGRWSVEKVIPE